MANTVFRKNISRSVGGNITVFFLLCLFGAYMALPLIYAVSSAFKPLDEIYIFPPRLFVRKPTLDNFVVLNLMTSSFWVPLSRYIFNSIFVSVVATSGHLLIASMAAYPLAKHKFPGQKIIKKVIVMSLLFTASVTYIPQYIVMAKLNILNSYSALIFPAFQTSLGLYLMMNFMQQINDSMLEAARIDGTGEFGIYWRIVMPNVKPAWLTLIIFAFQAIWNSNGTINASAGSTVIFNESLKVLPAILGQIIGGGIVRTGPGAAAALILMIPPILIFILSQNYVIETMSTSGLK